MPHENTHRIFFFRRRLPRVVCQRHALKHLLRVVHLLLMMAPKSAPPLRDELTSPSHQPVREEYCRAKVSKQSSTGGLRQHQSRSNLRTHFSCSGVESSRRLSAGRFSERRTSSLFCSKSHGRTLTLSLHVSVMRFLTWSASFTSCEELWSS